MFAIRPRTRSRRPSRFVPAVDGLSARIAPVCIAIPTDIDLAPPEQEATPTTEPTTEHPPVTSTEVREAFAAIEAMVLTTGAEI